MGARAAVLAVDIGTSATKAVLFDGDGRVLTLTRHAYPLLTPRPDWAEQDPDAVTAAVLDAMRETYANRPPGTALAAVALSCQWYSVLPVDGVDRPLSPFLTWSDRRSAAIAERLRRSSAGRAIYQTTGCPLDAIYPLAKIGWLREQAFAPRAARYISIKEYVVRRLFGEYLVDWSMASSSGLFDIRTRRWDPTALAAAGVREDQLSPPVSPKTILACWRPEILTQTGIPSGTPCVLGAGDGVLASIGVGAIGPGVAAVNVGTSAACRCLVQEPLVDPRGQLWTYALDEDWWVTGGIVSSGAVVYEWFLRNFAPGVAAPETIHALINERVATVAPGAEGLIFLPYLSGEQCPVWDPETTGGFHGLTLRHTKDHLARAVLEGITASIARILESLRKRFGVIDELRITGGLVNSSAWLQIAADLFGARIHVPETAEGSALGAAVMAWVALGMVPDLTAAKALARPSTSVEPNAVAHRFYREHLKKADRILQAVKSVRD